MTLRSLTAALLRAIQTNSGISQPALLLHKVHGWHTQGAKIPQAQKKATPGVSRYLRGSPRFPIPIVRAIASTLPRLHSISHQSPRWRLLASIASIVYAITHGAHPLRAIMPCAECPGNPCYLLLRCAMP